MTTSPPALTTPYWTERTDLPGLDFCRCLVPPGENDKFPLGVVAVYVDDDFWCVGALPYSQYVNVPIQQIVAEHWPDYVDKAEYTPDHGTHEREIYCLQRRADSEREKADHLWELFKQQEKDLARMRLGRTDMLPRLPSREEAERSYFVAQYEQLLAATAHSATDHPDPALAGLCGECGLLRTDRVHTAHWIAKRAEGVVPFHPGPAGIPPAGPNHPDRTAPEEDTPPDA